MPQYTYKCNNCGELFELNLSPRDDLQNLRKCPKCNKKTGKKIIIPVRIVFKGSGFYSTDNKKETDK